MWSAEAAPPLFYSCGKCVKSAISPRIRFEQRGRIATSSLLPREFESGGVASALQT